MPISDAIVGAVRAAQASVGITLTIIRGGHSTADVPALIGRSRDVRVTQDRLVVGVSVRDYKIVASDYVIDGEIVKPAKGDRLVETSDKVRTFEVLPTAGEGEFRASDPYHTVHRIHTKLIGEAPLE